jgi:hypothetical protein
MSKIKKATDAKAVIVCRRWIEKALKLGVVLKPGTYGWRDYAKTEYRAKAIKKLDDLGE